MRFVKSLVCFMVAFQLMVANAASGDENERLSNILRKYTTPMLKSMHSSDLDKKELGQSDKNTEKLVLALLLQN